MKIRILFEISPSDDYGLFVGRVLPGGEILSWNYKVPTTIVEGLREAKKVISHDAQRVYSFLSAQLKYSRLVTASIMYKIENMKVFYVENRRMCLLTMGCVSMMAVADIASTPKVPEKVFTNTPEEYRFVAENNKTYTVNVDTSKVSSKPPKKAKAKIIAKSTRVDKGYDVILPLPVKRIRPVDNITMGAFTSVLDKQLNAAMSEIKAETYVKLLLNMSEGFYPVPYWDNKQYSVGFGTYISRADCEVMWDKMGLSSTEGNKLAWKLHELGKTKKGYKKVLEILETWYKKPGTMNISTAENIRDKEFQGFLRSVKKQYPDMSYFQQLVLASTIYNTGWAGFRGGDYGTGKVLPVSKLALVLDKGDYSSTDIKWAYMRLKTHTNGHYNRRLREMRAFLAFSSVEERKKTIGHLSEAMAFDKKLRKS
jgi:hypothetical protein